LTANLQLQLRCNPPGRPPRSRGPDSSAWFEHRAFLGKLRSKAPPRHASRPRRYRPLSGRAALPLTSSVAAAPFELGLSASPALATTRPRLHSRLVKDDRFTGTRTPSTGDFSPASAIRTAHEHNHEPSDPGSISPTSACPARTGPTGLRPHPPCRPPNPDDAGASVPARSLRTVTGPSTQRLPGRLESGARRRCRRGTSPASPGAPPSSPCGVDLRAARCGVCPVAEVTSARESFAPTRSARTPLVTRPPRYRLEIRYRAPPAGRSRTPTRTIPPHEPFALASSKLMGPRTPCLRRPPAASHPLSREGPANRTVGCGDPLARPHSTARHGSANELLAQPARRGLGPPHPLPREEPRDQPHPRCLPSMSCRCLERRTCVQRGDLAGRSPQVVTNLWSTRGALFDPVAIAGLDGPVWTGTRSLL
jgi:hypothetical protein